MVIIPSLLLSYYHVMVNTKKFTLGMGILFGGLHFIWALCVAIMPTALQNFLNRILGLHFLQPYLIITPFVFGKMIMLVIITFIVGCIFGRLLSLIINMKK